MPMIENSKEEVALDQIFCIYYPVWFEKDEIRALINSSSKIIAMTLFYAVKLGLKVCPTDNEA